MIINVIRIMAETSMERRFSTRNTNEMDVTTGSNDSKIFLGFLRNKRIKINTQQNANKDIFFKSMMSCLPMCDESSLRDTI